MPMPDLSDILGLAKTVTSNAAEVIRGLVDAGEAGTELTLDKLGPLADQLDEMFGNADNPVPDPPAGGVPVDVSLERSSALSHIGVV